ncbi:MAG: DUF6220 domain-containing protein [Nitrososphaerales archaeon]
MEKVARYIYAGAAWLFVIGVVVQVFLAGMVVVAARMGWDAHAGLGHSLAGPLLFMLISMYLGRLPGPMKRLTWLLFGAYVLQADVLIFLRAAAPVAAAFHPVMALVDFALGVMLARAALPLLRPVEARAALRRRVEETV